MALTKIKGAGINISATEKLYFDGGGTTYIQESADGVLDFYADNVKMLELLEGATDYVWIPVDATKFAIGAGKDLNIYTSSDDAIIENITSDKDIIFKGNDGGSTITALTLDISAAGAATFNDKIIATELDISGNMDIDGTSNLDVVDIDGAVDMASTLAVGDNVTVTSSTSLKPVLKLDNTNTDANPSSLVFDKSVTGANDDILGRIDFTGQDTGNGETTFARIDGQIQKANATAESGKLVFQVAVDNTMTEFMRILGGSGAGGASEVIFNEGGGDNDFRVESDGNTHMLFVDAGNNQIGIGDSAPNSALTNFGAASKGISIKNAQPTIALTDTDTGSGHFWISNGGGISYFQNTVSGASFRFYVESTVALEIENDGVLKSSDGIEFEGTALGSGQTGIASSGDGGELRFYANGTQYLTLGTDGVATLAGNSASNYIGVFQNDGNNGNRFGINIICGNDDASSTNYAVRIADGDSDDQGYITFSGGTVAYGTFSAYHPCIIPDSDNNSESDENAYPYGTLLETTSLSYTQKNGADTERGIRYNVRKSQSANSKKVLGAYGSSMNDNDSRKNEHQALVLGDGHIICNNEGGNIEVGDGICTSSSEGIGMKATASPSMVIGIAQEDVSFSGSETKLVAVQYGLQQFTPW